MCRCVLWGPSVPGLSVDPPLVCPVSPVCDTGHLAKCPVSQTEVYVRLDCRVGVSAWFLWYSWLAAGTRWWRRENPLDGLEHTRTSINLDFKIYGHGSSVLICIHDSGFVLAVRLRDIDRWWDIVLRSVCQRAASPTTPPAPAPVGQPLGLRRPTPENRPTRLFE